MNMNILHLTSSVSYMLSKVTQFLALLLTLTYTSIVLVLSLINKMFINQI